MTTPTQSRTSRQGAPQRAGGRKTREQLMDVAEELFAASGVDGVSIRSVNAAAGLAPASVHYHFGDKDGLLRAVIARRGDAVVQAQLELVEALEARRRKPTAEEAVRVLADPFADLLRRDPVGGRRWLAMIANLVATNDDRVYQEGFGPDTVQARINRCAASVYPEQTPDAMAARWRMATTALLQLFASSDAAEFDDIVRFVAAGLDGVCRSRS